MKTISILTHSFLDAYNGRTHKMFGGGLERYIYDLCQVIKDLELKPEVHQLAGNAPFETEMEGIRVYGYASDAAHALEVFEAMATKAEGKLIYSSQIWQPLHYRTGSLAICHGINWDDRRLPNDHKAQIAVCIQRALNDLDLIVSVDSHFITYCRAVCQFNNDNRIVLIPNSVDTTVFRPSFEIGRSDDVLRILYPRRISYERGIIQMMLAADELLDRYPYVEIEFAGETIEGDVISEAFRTWLQNHPHRDRLVHSVLGFHDMHLAYGRSDIVVIPTIFSEGTSLSCLEALSCGKAVISTNVGGLNDIVIDGFNGILISPGHASIVATVSSLIQNKAFRLELGFHARQSAMAFDKRIWKKRWGELLT